MGGKPVDPEYYRKYYLKHREKLKARTKQRYLKDPKKALEYGKKYRRTSVGRAKLAAQLLRCRALYPERNLARQRVQKALERGVLVRQPCIICGTEHLVHAHHDDYSKPLEVIWLCDKHHKERHKQLKPMPSANEGVQT